MSVLENCQDEVAASTASEKKAVSQKQVDRCASSDFACNALDKGSDKQRVACGDVTTKDSVKKPAEPKQLLDVLDETTEIPSANDDLKKPKSLPEHDNRATPKIQRRKQSPPFSFLKMKRISSPVRGPRKSVSTVSVQKKAKTRTIPPKSKVSTQSQYPDTERFSSTVVGMTEIQVGYYTERTFPAIVGLGLMIDESIGNSARSFLSGLRGKSETAMYKKINSEVVIRTGKQRWIDKESHTHLDSRELLTGRNYLRGGTLNFYRYLLLNQDRERVDNYCGNTVAWRPSWIHHTDFMVMLLNNSMSTPKKKEWFDKKLVQYGDKVPGMGWFQAIGKNSRKYTPLVGILK